MDRYILQADVSDDEIPEWLDVDGGPFVTGLITDEQIGPTDGPARIVDTTLREVVAQRPVSGQAWEIEWEGLYRYQPPIDYVGFARSLLD